MKHLHLATNYRSYVIVMMAITLWAALPTLTKMTLHDMSLPTFLMLRFCASSILLLYFFKSILRKILKISWINWFLFSAVITVMFISQTYAIQEIPVSEYVIIFTLAPIIMILCLRYYLAWPAIVGILISIVCLFWFLTSSSKNNVFQLLPCIAVITGMLSWVFYSLLIRRFQNVYNDGEITALTSYIGAIIYINIFMVENHSIIYPDAKSISLAVLTGIFSAVAFFCYSYGMRYLPKFSVFGQYIEPIISVVIASFFLGNMLSGEQYVAGVCVLFGTVLATRFAKARRQLTS